VVIVSVYVLRDPLSRLIVRATRLREPGVDVTFAAEAQAARKDAEAAVPNPPDRLGESTAWAASLDSLLKDADREPIGAIVNAWNLVAAGKSGKPDDNGIRVLVHTRGMFEAKQVGEDILTLADRLYYLRNEVVHGTVIPTPRSAGDFVEASWRLSTALAAAAQHSTSTINPTR
jgi:hypothetical protein